MSGRTSARNQKKAARDRAHQIVLEACRWTSNAESSPAGGLNQGERSEQPKTARQFQRSLELMQEPAEHADGPPPFRVPPTSHRRRHPCDRQRPAHTTALPYILPLSSATPEWVLAMTIGMEHPPLRRTMPARALKMLEVEIARAKASFGLLAATPVWSCYEAGRDGFWLHRYLVSRASRMPAARASRSSSSL